MLTVLVSELALHRLGYSRRGNRWTAPGLPTLWQARLRYRDTIAVVVGSGWLQRAAATALYTTDLLLYARPFQMFGRLCYFLGWLSQAPCILGEAQPWSTCLRHIVAHAGNKLAGRVGLPHEQTYPICPPAW